MTERSIRFAPGSFDEFTDTLIAGDEDSQQHELPKRTRQ